MPQQSSSYDPTAEQPYQPYQAPEPVPTAPPTAAATQPGFQFTGAPTTKVGAIAGVLDNIFRGYMRGRMEGDARKVMQTKAKTDNLQNSYNQDAQLLHNMAASGVDPNSDEYKQAVSAVQGSWGALQDWIGQHVEGEETKKGKKSKSAQQAQSDPLLDLKSEDPNVRARALYALQKKMGPPILWQIKQYQTPEAQAARKAAQLGSQNTLSVEQATADRNRILAIPESQRTDKDKEALKSADEILTPPAKQTTEYDQERAAIARKVAEDPNYILTDSEKAILAGGKPTYPKAPGATGNLKPGTLGFALTQKYGPNPTYEQYLEARRDEARARHIAGAGRGSGAGADKNYQKWDAYYKEHYPSMGADDRDALVRRKVEGSSQITAGGVSADAATQPKQFDSDVLAQAIDNLRKLPQYSGNTPKIQNLDDALANIVGLGDDGYMYHPRSYIQEHGADSHGKFSGDVTEDQLKGLERDLQTQIRVILSKQTGLPPEQKRAAAQRMTPLFGPAATFGPEPAVPKSTSAAASPQPGATPPPAPNRLSAPAGGHGHKAGPAKGSKGEVWKSDFLKANQGATDADWQAMKTQLEQEGYATKDQ